MSRSTSTAVLLAVLAALLGVGLWYGLSGARTAGGEEDLDLPMACTACGHRFTVSHDGLIALSAAATAPARDGHAAAAEPLMGPCPKCGKQTVHRVDEESEGTA